eukprot:gnl/TRDRNA2_/TRDRNA2_194978_c0_seq1.p1 gnl/TRDRNA2_/TRDRNA2_194978_c0~~gnl/TRDRNA2_/TRDRNA2_194978_c0_seq1.p1  ORF type:complete len:303 (-),score=42.11 gnl/TRDRNA2_/TRDRNA2_194978_c0_seq1:21-929(-)
MSSFAMKINVIYWQTADKDRYIVAAGEWKDRGLEPPASNMTDIPMVQEVDLHDVRRLVEKSDTVAFLNERAFAVCAHSSKMAYEDYFDDTKVTSTYYTEAQDFLKQLTGASRVHIFEHTLRSSGQSIGNSTYKDNGPRVDGPAAVAHNDFSQVAALQYIQRTQKLSSLAEAEEFLKAHHVVFVNVWRNIRATPVKDFPLAVLDKRSSKSEEHFDIKMIHMDREGGVRSVLHSPNHRWFYASDMSRDEVLLLKLWDSEIGPLPTAHSAVKLPDEHVPADCPPRESLEMRTILVWPKHGTASRL